jgi:hypothetical protein
MRKIALIATTAEQAEMHLKKNGLSLDEYHPVSRIADVRNVEFSSYIYLPHYTDKHDKRREKLIMAVRTRMVKGAA